MTEFDPKLKHLLKNWFHGNDGNHESCLMFKDNDIYQFKDFVKYDVQLLYGKKRQKHNISTPFKSINVKKISNVLLYYRFMRNEDNAMVQDPVQWVMIDFKRWRVSNKINTRTHCFEDIPQYELEYEKAIRVAEEEDRIRSWRIAAKIASNKKIISGNSAKEGTDGIADDDEIDNTKSYSNTVPTATTPEEPKNVSNKDIISNLDAVAATIAPVPIPITTSSTPAICTEMVIKEEEIALNETCTCNKDAITNLNFVTTADKMIDRMLLLLTR